MLFWFITSLLSFASPTLQTGDVLLQPLHCYLCDLIEAEEDSIYSHVGIVVFDQKDQILVAEAYGSMVRLVTLDQFLLKTQKSQSVLALRPKEVIQFSEEEKNNFSLKLIADYQQFWAEVPYDSAFSMDDDKVYCSELVLKLLNPFLSVKIPTKKMHFDKNREHWLKYFSQHVPDGEQGISPADFERSNLFEILSHKNLK
jgi:hypothetical protein